MLTLLGEPLASRLLLGTARFPSIDLLSKHLITDKLEVLSIPLLPNTAGCHNVQQAITTARLAHEIFGTLRIQLKVIGSSRMVWGSLSQRRSSSGKGSRSSPPEARIWRSPNSCSGRVAGW